MSSQSAFAAALLNPDLPCPGGLSTWNGSAPATRFAVYRNNVTVSLVDALADTFPVLQALVGEEFFRAMARVLAYHAADVDPLQPETLQTALTDPDKLTSLRLVLHPSVQIIQSPFAVFSLWAAHQGALCISTLDPEQAQVALVFRNGLDVETMELVTSSAVFASALQTGQTLMAATDAASCTDPEFDLTHVLALLLRWQLITHITTGDEHHEHTH